MDYEKEGSLHQMFVRQAEKTPDVTAVVADDGRTLSFEELHRMTDVLAMYLRQKGCTIDSVVGIYMERSLEYPVAYIAALKAGGAYMPIELSYPEPLLLSIMEDAKPVAVITTLELKDRLPACVEVITLDDGWEQRLSEENEKFPPLSPVNVELDNLAYVVYSSGTTGRPKGKSLNENSF